MIAAIEKIAVGVGCDRGVSFATLDTALRQALAAAAVQADEIAAFASIELKQDEIALLQLARHHGRPLHFYAAAQLAAIAVPNPSETVRRHTGTPAVAEAAALLAANTGMADLLIEKHKYRGADGKHVTISIARHRTQTLSLIEETP